MAIDIAPFMPIIWVVVIVIAIKQFVPDHILIGLRDSVDSMMTSTATSLKTDKHGRPKDQDHMARMLKDVVQAARLNSDAMSEVRNLVLTGDRHIRSIRVPNVTGVLADGLIIAFVYKKKGIFRGTDVLLAFAESVQDLFGPEIVIRSRGFDSNRGIRFVIPAITDVHYVRRADLYEMIDRQFIDPRMKHLREFDVKDQSHRQLIKAMTDTSGDSHYIDQRSPDYDRFLADRPASPSPIPED